MRSVVDKVAIGDFSLRILEFSDVIIILRLLHTDHQPPTINALDLNYLQGYNIKHFEIVHAYSSSTMDLSFLHVPTQEIDRNRTVHHTNSRSVHTLQNNITQTYDRSIPYRTTSHKLAIGPYLTEQHYTNIRSVHTLQYDNAQTYKGPYLTERHTQADDLDM